MSTKPPGLSDLLFGQIRGRILALLYGWHDKAFYVRQIARHVHASAGSVRRELEKLAAVDLITRTSIGNQVFYRANQSNPVFAEMRALVNKTVGIFNTLRSALEKFGTNQRSFCVWLNRPPRGKAGSDIDLMIVGSILDLTMFLLRLPEAETALGRAVNPTVYSMAEFNEEVERWQSFSECCIRRQKSIFDWE